MNDKSIPGSTFPRLPLAELDCGARSFAEDTEGDRVGRAWRRRAAAGGPVALGRASVSRGMLKPRWFENPRRHDVESVLRPNHSAQNDLLLRKPDYAVILSPRYLLRDQFVGTYYRDTPRFHNPGFADTLLSAM